MLEVVLIESLESNQLIVGMKRNIEKETNENIYEFAIIYKWTNGHSMDCKKGMSFMNHKTTTNASNLLKPQYYKL